jgi:hypothetical protein
MRRHVLPALFLALLLCLVFPPLAMAQEKEFEQAAGLMDTLIKYLYVIIAVTVAVQLFFIVVFWIIFAKAGEPGWASLIPIYNAFVAARMVDGVKWFVLFLIPPITIVAMFWWIFVYPFALANKFGKGAGFGLGLLFFGLIFYPILAFGSAQYQGRYSGERRRIEAEEDDYQQPRRRVR